MYTQVTVTYCLAVVVLLLPLTMSETQIECASLSNCKNCTALKNCVWCRQKNFEGNRCINIHMTSTCEAKFLVNAYETVTYKRNIELSDEVQLRPQNIEIKNVRKGQRYTIPVQFKQAKDYPIDLYILMDLSWSMKDDKEKLTILTTELAQTMRTLTKNLTIGFGSFIDKPIAPFTDINNAQQRNAYSFLNHMKLANNIERFRTKVGEVPNNGNQDLPEGAFEALLQVLKCNTQIGWREKARHLAIVATDDHPQLAGNGRMGGILTPNDGQCHLDSSGEKYTHGLLQDYPSVGQISMLAYDNSVNVIFAVVEEKEVAYRGIIPLIKGSSLSILSKDSSNIVKLVKEEYESITSEVELVNNKLEGVNIRYFSTCLEKTGSAQETSICKGLKVGSLVNYTISIEVTDCPPNAVSHDQTIVISPIGLTDKLSINLQIECECPCERADTTSCPDRCQEMAFCIQRCNIEIDHCPENCTHLDIARMKETGTEDNEMSIPHRCEVFDTSYNCKRDFSYGFDDKDRIIVRYSNCQSEISLTTIGFALMGALVGLGLAVILLFRLILYIMDRKEYARFINESQNAKWTADSNPLYVDATSNFQNPTFKE